jgi:hypothetical protein
MMALMKDMSDQIEELYRELERRPIFTAVYPGQTTRMSETLPLKANTAEAMRQRIRKPATILEDD